MDNEQTKIKHWMQLFGQQCPDKVTIPDLETRRLRAELILEETIECVNALGFCVNYDWNDFNEEFSPNLTELADGLADLNYVTKGTAVACGIDMEPIFEEVHKSNMSKFWKSGKQAADMDYTDIKLLTDIEGGSEPLYIVRDSSGKVIKPPSFQPPNIKL